MSFWKLAFACLLGLTLFLGLLLLRDGVLPDRRSSENISTRIPPSRASKQTPVPPDLVTISAATLKQVVSSVVSNRELLVYGGFTAFGVLMMGLAIGSATSNSRQDTDALIQALQQEKEKAENLAKLKAEFLNQVSHELRTPLAVIIGYIECITDGLYGQVEGKHQEILQIVAKQSSHLKNMIDQILIYARLEAGKQPLRLDECSLTKLLGDLKDTFDFLCRQKGLELRWDLPRTEFAVRTDSARLKEIISNLLQNAIKYTDAGHIAVRLENQSSREFVTVAVSDTGVGIAEHQLESIFEPFMQVHKTSTENSRGGIGLGLSIVKKHLEQIHGKIAVESQLGRGSTFRVTLPRHFTQHKSRLLGFIRASGWHFWNRSRPKASNPQQLVG